MVRSAKSVPKRGDTQWIKRNISHERIYDFEEIEFPKVSVIGMAYWSKARCTASLSARSIRARIGFVIHTG